MLGGDGLQLAHHHRGQLARSHDGGGRHLLHQRHELRRRGLRRGNLVLDVAQDGAALVDTADRVELRAGNAVRRREHVVRDDDARALGVSLVQSADVPKVPLALGELPAAVQGGTVEVSQRHAARVAVLVLHDVVLDVQALLVSVPAVAIDRLADGPRGNLEGHRALSGLLCALSAAPPQSLPRGRPIREPIACRRQHGQEHVAGDRRDVPTLQVHDHVGIDHGLRLLRRWCVVVHTQGAVGRVQARRGVLLHEALEGGRQHRGLPEGHTSRCQPALEDARELTLAMPREGGRGRGRIPTIAAIVEAADVPVVSGDEVAMQQIARSGGREQVTVHFRHCAKSGQHGALDGSQACLHALAVGRTQRGLQLVEEVPAARRLRRASTKQGTRIGCERGAHRDRDGEGHRPAEDEDSHHIGDTSKQAREGLRRELRDD
mmetsp:Transcript_104787/g.301571  ORF Transcript_104787/g.301571 Transcript_104787/m.301571 type:complete len:434 (-) Transcript_104787:38-1339(-)